MILSIGSNFLDCVFSNISNSKLSLSHVFYAVFMSVRTSRCVIHLYVLIWKDSRDIILFNSNKLHVCTMLSHF